MSFRAHYRSHLPLVRAEVSRFNLPSQTRDDVIQEVFLALWRHYDELPAMRSPAAWLRVTARRRAINAFARVEREVAYEAVPESVFATLTPPLDDCSDHEERDRQRLDAVVSQLADERFAPRGRVATMYYEEGLTVGAIATRLEIPKNTVLSHLHRFRRLVRARAAE